MCSAAGVIKDPPVVNWKDTGGTIPVDINTVVILPITTTQVRTGTGTFVPQISIGSQKIKVQSRSIIPQEVRNYEPLDSPINIIPAEHSDPMPTWSKVIGSKQITNKSADIYTCSRMNFRSDTVLSESPNFIHFGVSSIITTDELRYVFVPTTIIGRPTDGSNWLLSGHDINESTAVRLRGTKAKNHYNFKVNF